MVSSSLNLKKIISKHFVKCWDGKKILEQINVEHTAYNLSGSSNGSSWSTLLFMSGVNSPVSFAPFSLFFAAGLFGLVTLDFRRFFCSYKIIEQSLSNYGYLEVNSDQFITEGYPIHSWRWCQKFCIRLFI